MGKSIFFVNCKSQPFEKIRCLLAMSEFAHSFICYFSILYSFVQCIFCEISKEFENGMGKTGETCEYDVFLHEEHANKGFCGSQRRIFLTRMYFLLTNTVYDYTIMAGNQRQSRALPREAILRYARPDANIVWLCAQGKVDEKARL